MKSNRNEFGFIPTNVFKLPQQFKRIAATIVDDEARSVFKRASIQAVLASQEVVDRKSNSTTT